jgi:formylglycine-generating enzyme required for sulfatase activity
MSDIFISYKREEHPIARKLADALEREGWTVWWDPKLRAGEHFDDVIEKALTQSKCVLVLWSKLSVNSRYVKDEAMYALRRGKLMPVAVEEVDLPFRFEGIHTQVLRKWDGARDSTEFCKLVADIRAHIGAPTRPTVDRADTNDGGFNLSDWTPESAAHRKPDNPTQPGFTLRDRAPAPFHLSTPSVLKPGTIFRDTLKDGSLGPEMVVVPAGTFHMGNNQMFGSKPVHTVDIQKPFAIGRYEVTFEQWDKYASLTQSWFPQDENWGRGKRPIINISQHDAKTYTEWLSRETAERYRLPTEAEWEYAARSGTYEIWAGTSDMKQLAQYAVFDTKQTQPVGTKKPNGFGLYDMSGNVWEWVEDCWHKGYYGAPADGSAWLQAMGGDCDKRVVRGGFCESGPVSLISTFRYRYPNMRYFKIGFRLVRDLP